MSRPDPIEDLLAARDTWPEPPTSTLEAHARLRARLGHEAAVHRRRVMVRIMRLYWLAFSVLTLFLLTRLPGESSWTGALLLVGTAAAALVVCRTPKALRTSTLGELLLETVED